MGTRVDIEYYQFVVSGLSYNYKYRVVSPVETSWRDYEISASVIALNKTNAAQQMLTDFYRGEAKSMIVEHLMAQVVVGDVDLLWVDDIDIKMHSAFVDTFTPPGAKR